jgi:hypothetical protein
MQYFDFKIQEVDWNTWFYSTGMPPIENHFDDELSKRSKHLAWKWTVEYENETFHVDDIKNWSTIEICL